MVVVTDCIEERKEGRRGYVYTHTRRKEREEEKERGLLTCFADEPNVGARLVSQNGRRRKRGINGTKNYPLLPLLSLRLRYSVC